MKYTKFLSFAVAFLLFSCVYATDKETREVDDFSNISLGINADLYLKIGPKQSVVLEGDDLDKIETVVENGRLKIKREGTFQWGNLDKIKIYITATKIDGLSVAGSGSIKAESTIKTDDLNLSVSGSGDIELSAEADDVKISVTGSGDIKMNIDADDLDMKVSGSGDIELEGKADDVDVKITGSGSIDAEDLQASDVDVNISGSGTCKVGVSNSLDAKISGSGSVYYKGNPDKVQSHSSGSGRVKKM